MAQTKRENTHRVLAILLVFLALAGIVFYFRDTLLRFCSCEYPGIQRWPRLSTENRGVVKTIFQLGGLLQVVYLVVQLAFGPGQVEKALSYLSKAMLNRTLILRDSFAKVVSWVRPGLKIPKGRYYAPGMRWWEDGPLVALWAWIVGGRPHLGQRMIDMYAQLVSLVIPRSVPFPQAELAVGVPLGITGFLSLLMLLYWLACIAYLVLTIVKGLWAAPKSNRQYCVWLGEKVRTLNEWADSFPPAIFRHDDHDSRVGVPRAKPKLSQCVGPILLVALFLWSIWPAILYLYALSLILWLLSGVLLVLARISSFALKYGPLPRSVVLIGVMTALLACWLGVM